MAIIINRILSTCEDSMVKEDLIKDYICLRDKIIEKEFSHLDAEQRAAVLSREGNLLVAACPGSGKTTVLVNRVLYLTRFGCIYKSSLYPEKLKPETINYMKLYLKESNSKSINYKSEQLMAALGFNAVKPENIIILTFTKAAANNMKERFLALSGNTAVPFFGTFHGLFYRLLLKKIASIRIIEDKEAYRIISDSLSKYTDEVTEEKVQEIRNHISAYKINGFIIDKINMRIDKQVFMDCFQQYEAYKTRNNLKDFDDLQLSFKTLLIENPRVLEGYRRYFKFMLIDEFQDCDEMQVQILMLLNQYNSIFAVGDEDQSIYSFRGSRPDFMINFKSLFTGGKHVYLSTNYRSTANIVELANTLIRNNAERNNKNMKAFNKDRKLIGIRLYPDENSEAKFITDIIKEQLKQNYKYSDFAVLYRTNIESRSVIDALIKDKIPFKLLDREYNFFEHFICRDVIAYLKLSLTQEDCESFKRIINKPFRYISNLSIKKVMDSDVRQNCFEFAANLKDTPVFQKKNLYKLEKQIKHLKELTLHKSIEFILEKLDYICYLKSYGEKFKIKQSDLMDIIMELKEAVKGFNNLEEFLKHVDRVQEEMKSLKNKQSQEDSVIVSTIHGVKGMEFNNVFIMNCVEELLPHKNNLTLGLEEERRLFYVALTRAKHNLYLCLPRQVRGTSRKSSRFIAECGEKLTEDIEQCYKMDEVVIHNSFGRGKVIKVNSEEIEIRFENMISRRFDLRTVYSNGIIKKAN